MPEYLAMHLVESMKNFGGKISARDQLYEDINELYLTIIRRKDSTQLKLFFSFLKKNPHYAPFNNALVFAQNPNCVYYMTADQWLKHHKRTVNEGARPMIILFPFAPVKFVYDYYDTHGSGILSEDDVLSWWHEDKGLFEKKIFHSTVSVLHRRFQVPLVHKDPSQFFIDNSLSTGGYASGTKHSNHAEIILHPRYITVTDENVTEAYGILVHEIAHIFLGHLGIKKYEIKKNDVSVYKDICEDRSFVLKSVKELEAELTAWLVFNRFGVAKHSVDYMAIWLSEINDWRDVNISLVLRTSKTIFDMT